MNSDIEPAQLFFSFDQWYEKNARWKCTDYHHLFYSKQAADYFGNYRDNSRKKLNKLKIGRSGLERLVCLFL